jgi:hypothetical protein
VASRTRRGGHHSGRDPTALHHDGESQLTIEQKTLHSAHRHATVEFMASRLRATLLRFLLRHWSWLCVKYRIAAHITRDYASPTRAMPPDELGEAMSWLLITPDRWVKRRVEAIKFTQQETRRHESVDFVLPKSLVARLQRFGITTLPVPLAILAKRPLASLDVSNAAGHSLSVYTRRDNEAFMTEFLRRSARKTLNLDATAPVEVAPGIQEQLGRVVIGESNVAAKAVEEIRQQADTCPESQAATLWNTELFRGLLLMAALGHPFIVEVPVTRQRQIVKYSFAADTPLHVGEDDYEWAPPVADSGQTLTKWQRLARRLLRARAFLYEGRWWHRVRRYPVRRASDCASYHFEISAPTGFELRDVCPLIPDQGRGKSKTILAASTALFPTKANVHISRLPEALAANLQMEVHVRLPRRGVLTYCLFSTVLTLIAVGGVGVLARHLLAHTTTGGLSAGVTVLLATASGINLYFVRPGEHPSFSSMLVGFRLLLVLSAISGLIGVGLLLTGTSSHILWRSAGVLSLVAAILVGYGWWRTGRDPDGVRT